METIKDIIINDLEKRKQFTKKEIKYAINKIERMTIKKSTFFSKAMYKTFNELGIEYVYEIFSLNSKEASKILKITNSMLKQYIKDIESKITAALIHYNRKKIKKKQAIYTERKLRIIIDTIKQDETLVNLLREEIIYQEKYNDLDVSEQRITKPFYYCKLNLNNYELYILRKYLLKTIEPSNEESFFEAIINIYYNLHFFIKKIQYKTIIDKNYNDLEELNFSRNEIRLLNRMNINYASELIELNNLNETKHILNRIRKQIENALQENNIVIPKNIEQLEELFIQENAGIKDKKIVK